MQAVPLTVDRLRQLLGMDLDIARAETVLASLGITTRRTGPDSLEADPPYWRSDIAIEEDLIEEVIRIIGYDEVPTTMLSSPIPYHQGDAMMTLKDNLRDALSAAGMQETISYPLVSPDDLTKLGRAAREPATLLRVANPMSAEQDVLRPTLAASVLNTLAYNQGHNDGGFRLFELGRAFVPQDADLPQERELAAGVMSGPRYDANWLSGSEPLDFYDLSGALDTRVRSHGNHRRLPINRGCSVSPWPLRGNHGSRRGGRIHRYHRRTAPGHLRRFRRRTRPSHLLRDSAGRCVDRYPARRSDRKPVPVAVPLPSGQP